MALRRKFIAHLSSGPVTIPDPGQAYSPDEVRQMAAADYPELTSAASRFYAGCRAWAISRPASA